ncbi:MAG: hypothetical protein ACRBN8_06480 [Nannocystales bacterium]
MVKRLAMAVVVLWMSPGCRSKPASVPPPTEPPSFDDDPGATPRATPSSGGAPHESPDGEPTACKAGGSPWDGKHEGCLYEVAGCCYGDAQAACHAAGCEGTGCQVLESAPAQIVCRPD